MVWGPSPPTSFGDFLFKVAATVVLVGAEYVLENKEDLFLKGVGVAIPVAIALGITGDD
jgi:hypothetical protein